MSTRLELRERLLAGALGGAMTGAILAVLAALMWNHAVTDWVKTRISLATLSLGYVLLGTGIGTVLGGIFPWARTELGSIVTGAVAMVLIYVSLGAAMGAGAAAIAFVAVVGVVVGGLGGRRVLGPGSPYLN